MSVPLTAVRLAASPITTVAAPASKFAKEFINEPTELSSKIFVPVNPEIADPEDPAASTIFPDALVTDTVGTAVLLVV
jgi:hypothetical protein